MKYNKRYQKLSTVNEGDPSPMSREGVAALVDMFWALRLARALEVGAGGAAPEGGYGSHPPFPPKKTKSKFSTGVVAITGSGLIAERGLEIIHV